MSTVFTKIIEGEIPAYKIAEDDHFLAFLDVMPLVKGHTLVIPKKETDLIFDMETDEYFFTTFSSGEQHHFTLQIIFKKKHE